MKNISLIIFLLLFSLAGLASEKSNKLKIALIISLQAKEGKAFFNNNSYDINARIEKEFKKSLDLNSFELVVVKNATLASIWNTLHDPSIYGVFFVGHAGVMPKNQSNNILSIPSLIADQNLYNVKNAFQSVHSNLRYLALISCNAEGILQSFIDKGYYENAPELKVMAFDKKIEFSEGIKEVLYDKGNPLVKAESYDDLFPISGPCRINDDLNQTTVEACKENAISRRKLKANLEVLNKRYEDISLQNNFTFTRVIPAGVNLKDIQPTLILANNRVIGFFDQANPGSIQSLNAHLSDEELTSKITISNDSGAPSTKIKSTTILGELNLTTENDNCELQGIRSLNGQLLGIGKNVYNLRCP
jgi:hypothetical protein